MGCKRRLNTGFLILLITLLLGGTAILSWAWAGEQRTMAAPLPQASALSRLGLAAASPANSLGATPTPDCGLAWRIVSSPNPGQYQNGLSGVDALSGNDVWAVGSYQAGERARTMTLRWDGTRWTHIPSPNSSEGSSDLLADVSAISPNDVWAVGNFLSPDLTLKEHRDGAQWSVIPSPDVVTGTSALRGVDAISPSDVWAVGSYPANVGGIGYYRTLIEHWDDAEWSIVSSPSPSEENNELWDVSVISATDVWAVGYFRIRGIGNRTLTLHWDGTQWSHIPSPNAPGSYGNILWGVSALSSNDVWAVGRYEGPDERGMLFLHWDGGQWTYSTIPGVYIDNFYLHDVEAIAPNDVWAVGYLSSDAPYTLAMHWDGIQWTRVPSPGPGTIENFLFGVAAVSSSDVWAVGDTWSGSGRAFETLIERYNDPCISPTPTATATQTITSTITATATATTTPTPATPTVAPTTISPTPCALAFTDVPSENTFYTQIRCLACRGIVSGYSDGTFRPNSDVTRGQISKIVANSAGFKEAPTEWTFQDAPSSHTFYVYIERMAGRGIISGYPCGGPGEPCVGPENRPYFRPGSNATRGQISKIVANAAEFNDPPGEPIFEDVPPTNTFYNFIQRLAVRGIMGGYPCGGPNEPCGPGGRPYFRWGNNATRGQTSKIVANTFFPGCEAPR